MQLHGMEINGRAVKINHPNGWVKRDIQLLRPPESLLRQLNIPIRPDGALPVPMGAPAGPLTNQPLSIETTFQRKARELYVGNLAQGVVTGSMLKDLFLAPLSTLPCAAGAMPAATA